MSWLYLLSYFFGGVFAANAVPHYVAGISGRAFQSPFANPPGKGLSSARTNVLWGLLNLVVAYGLLVRVGASSLHNGADVIAVGLGALLLSLQLAHHFSPFHGGRVSQRP